MKQPVEVQLFFNFRSPYCYLASQSMWPIFDNYAVRMIWRPLAGWDGRTPPEQAKVKIPLARQDVARWCRRLGLTMNPPPVDTDPTHAALLSLLAEEQGMLREYIQQVMLAEWAEGKNIGEPETLIPIAMAIGLEQKAVTAVFDSSIYQEQLQQHKKVAEQLGVIGVPTFVIGDEIFWGNDRQDFVHEHLVVLGAEKSSKPII